MIYLRRQAKVRELATSAHEARAKVRRLFEEDMRNRRGGEPGWGQFLDGPKDPRGSYGTSAGVQVLAMDGYPTEGPGLGEALSYLNSLHQGENREIRADLAVTYKLACLAEAADPSSPIVRDPCLPMDRLISNCAPIGGWPESSEGDWTPNFLATAVALYALRRYPLFTRSENCVRSLRVLSKLVLEEDSRLRASEIALAALVLTNPWPSRSEVVEVESAIQRCHARLKAWTRIRRAESLGYPEMFVFRSGGDNRYLILLPDCLAALALLQLDSTSCAHGFVPKVTTFFTESMASGSGFRSPITGRVSTVDHLWLARLFRSYADVTLNEIPTPELRLRSGLALALGHAIGAASVMLLYKWQMVPYQNIFSISVLGLLGVSLGYFTFVAKRQILKVIFTAEASVFLALLARLLYDLLRGV